VIDSRRPPVFPSELERTSAETFHLAGRVVEVKEGSIVVADAFATAVVRGAVAAGVGDLVVLSVRASDPTSSLGVDYETVIELHTPRAGHRFEHGRLLDERIGSNLLARARAFSLVRSFFGEREFLEVDTPLLVPSPGLDLHLDAVEATGGYLITSPEYQLKRLLAAGVPRLFQMSHVFRQGELGVHHNPEFTMLEWYRAFAGVDDVMRDTEELVAALFASLGAKAPMSPPFPRITVCEAFGRFASVLETEFFSMAEADPDRFFRILVERVEPALASFPAVFLVDYPIAHASLARAKPGDARVAERFELYASGVELCNGFGELTDPSEQRRRLVADQDARRALGKSVYPVDERFVAALEEGMPPAAGNALGFDRIVALCLGEREIARVMPFPSGWV